MIELTLADRAGITWAQRMVTQSHYLHSPVDSRCSVEAYIVSLDRAPVGCLIFGRPEATRCYPWYSSVEDVRSGKCEVTRWQVLNLARVWFDPMVQHGGAWCNPDMLPGYADRKGIFRSTLASAAIRMAGQLIGYEYLLRRPPCFLDEPFEIRYLLSYADTRLHRGVIYQASGFERFRINDRGIETWRLPLPSLTLTQDAEVCAASLRSPRSRAYRMARDAEKMQPALF